MIKVDGRACESLQAIKDAVEKGLERVEVTTIPAGNFRSHSGSLKELPNGLYYARQGGLSISIRKDSDEEVVIS